MPLSNDIIDFLSEDPVLPLGIPEVRDHIRLPKGFGKHDYLLSAE